MVTATEHDSTTLHLGIAMTLGTIRGINVLSALAIACGAAGMAVSYLFICLPSLDHVFAGAAGFVAGSILVGTGLVSQALMSNTVPRTVSSGSS
ncbi:MAG: hypothetical protein AAGI22_03360 [Planctomycetota bacterium]